MNDTKLIYLYESARNRYEVDVHLREYHNFEHAMDVVMYASEINNGNLSKPLEIAALYHDAIYIPKAGGDANEMCSAAALAIDAKHCGYSINDPDIKLAQDLIRFTTVNNHLINGQIDDLYGSLMDADLASLSREWGYFVDRQIAIIHENGGDDTPQNRQLSATFLVQFLHKREFIYHTDFAREHYEQSAKDNIRRWVNENGTI